MTLEESAEYLRISPSTLRRLIHKGEAPYQFRPAGRKMVFRKIDLDMWANKRVQEGKKNDKR
ncbi:helix-turn-helix domain-containing protein [Alloscardovia macacae]